MNTMDVLEYGHQTVLGAIDEVPEGAWEMAGACGEWSVKDIIAHLASFEQVLVDVLTSLVDDEAATPALDTFRDAYEQFNEEEVSRRCDNTVTEIVQEYTEAYAEAQRLLAQIPDDVYSRNGVLSWYGDDYDLDDFLVYTFYGHKREHCAQIGVFCDRLTQVTAEAP